MDLNDEQMHYLRLLAQQYPTIQSASTEIISLTARLDLPKGTEHFLSDIHGEFEAFLHVLKNGSGSIKRTIEENFSNTMTADERRHLATLIYYPEQKLPLILKQVDNVEDWYRITLYRLVKLCRLTSAKYTRTEVRRLLPDEFTFVIDELLHEQEDSRRGYYRSLIESIISTGSARAFITAMAELIQRLSIAHLHIIGDVFDRGPGAHLIMDTLMEYHSLDIQWGNHDIVWMGAAAGSEACLANVLRVCLRYANMETLENGYAISLLPLASFAMETYGDDACALFSPKTSEEEQPNEHDRQLMAKMHKAIAIMQFKVEGQIIQRRPHYDMEDRLLLDKIDYEAGTVQIGDKTYPLLDTHFPTIDPADPYCLSNRERDVLEKLKLSFLNSEKLQTHVRFLFSKGSMYLAHNGNLLYHGCIPMTADGEFAYFHVDGEKYAAREFMDRVERLTRQGYFTTDDAVQRRYGQDAMWYLWSGAQSPLFGKDKMATFERYFVAEEETHTEHKNAYYDFRDREETADMILSEFGLDPDNAHIVNGHVPVKVKKGESPIKAGGKLLVIDGGFSKAYQSKTGIAGYTLIYNSYGLLLAAHNPFESMQKAVEDELDIDSKTKILEANHSRIRTCDTDLGRRIQQRINELKDLLAAYRAGLIKESSVGGKV